tara:strand:- start:119 stop:868 length:750 start_codon:yes stop_codon:yes gene_type:complete
MKFRNLILAIILFVSCDNDSVWDCIQLSGEQTSKVFSVENFDKIVVNRDINLIIRQGNDFNVEVYTGINLLDDINATVNNGELQLIDSNYCNFVRDYGETTFIVTAPDIIQIRNNSQYKIISEGILHYSDLTLISDDYNNSDNVAVGDFELELNSSIIRVISNKLSSFYLSGNVNEISIEFYSGFGRFEGENLISNFVNIYHRGENDIIVNPQISLVGELRSTGNLIATNTPDIVDVAEYYTGSLIFDD